MKTWKLSWLEILEPGPDGAALEELVVELLHLAAVACKSIVWSIVPWLRSWHFICDMKQGDVQFRACVTSWAPIFGQPPSAARHMKLAMRVPAAGGARTFAVDVLFAQSSPKCYYFKQPLMAAFAPRIALTAADWTKSLCSRHSEPCLELIATESRVAHFLQTSVNFSYSIETTNTSKSPSHESGKRYIWATKYFNGKM